jgi:hypothetical protein
METAAWYDKRRMSDFMTRKEIDRNRISLVWAKV